MCVCVFKFKYAFVLLVLELYIIAKCFHSNRFIKSENVRQITSPDG